MNVKDIMTYPVLAVRPSASVTDAARLMLTHQVSGLPVIEDDGTLAGIVSEGDFLRRAELGTGHKRAGWLEFFVSPGKAAEEYVQAHGRKIIQIMQSDVATITPDATLEDAVEHMASRGVKRLPVIKGGKVVGIVSRSDLMRAMLRVLPRGSAAFSNDERIRTEILTELAQQTWARNGAIRVIVDKGVVELSGTIFDERIREAARIAAENVAGVTKVVDQLVWLEPMSGMMLSPPL
jgi:CBS domain-containing protein